MYKSKIFLVFPLLALTLLIHSGVWTVSPLNSEDYTDDDIASLYSESHARRTYWSKIDTRLNSNKAKKNMTLNRDEIDEFEKYASEQYKNFDSKFNTLEKKYGRFY